jgi:hypothetical protein
VSAKGKRYARRTSAGALCGSTVASVATVAPDESPKRLLPEPSRTWGRSGAAAPVTHAQALGQCGFASAQRSIDAIVADSTIYFRGIPFVLPPP